MIRGQLGSNSTPDISLVGNHSTALGWARMEPCSPPAIQSYPHWLNANSEMRLSISINHLGLAFAKRMVALKFVGWTNMAKKRKAHQPHPVDVRPVGLVPIADEVLTHITKQYPYLTILDLILVTNNVQRMIIIKYKGLFKS